jgi:hypothetical protein
MMLTTFAAAGSSKSTGQQPVWTYTLISSAVSVPAGAITSPGGLTVAFSEPSWAMPDLRGWRLNAAKREILRLTDGNVASLKSHDATGAGRAQFWDPNWRVCSQNVPPGAKITTTTTIDFGVAKIREAC